MTLTHDNVVASIETFHRIVPPMDHRIVSLLPLSHLLEQSVGLYYALTSAPTSCTCEAATRGSSSMVHCR